MNLITFLLLNIGFTYIVTYSTIFGGFRSFFERVSPNFWGVLFSCPQCFGFWSAIILDLVIGYTYSEQVIVSDTLLFTYFTSYFLDGLISSGVNFLLSYIIVDFEFKQDYLNSKSEYYEKSSSLIDYDNSKEGGGNSVLKG